MKVFSTCLDLLKGYRIVRVSIGYRRGWEYIRDLPVGCQLKRWISRKKRGLNVEHAKIMAHGKNTFEDMRKWRET